MSRSRTATVAAAAIALLLVLVPLTAGGQEGRPDGATPGVPAAEAPAARAAGTTGWDGDGPAPRVLHAGNVTTDGSHCIGNDCNTDPPSPGYGFDTLRLMENNLRILAFDTSGGSFPTRDWQIEFNSSSNGGPSYYMVRDCANTASTSSTCNGTAQFTIEAGADNDSIYVDSSGNQGGNVGFGTTSPAVDLDVLSGNTPTLRLQQDASSGFGPQTWDVAGNEANFFIRDVTNGSSLPIRIEPGVASNTLYLDNAERVGINDSSPDGVFDVDVTGRPDALVIRAPGTGAGNVGIGTSTPGEELHIVGGSGSPAFRLQGPTNTWDTRVFAGTGDSYEILHIGDVEPTLRLAPNGDVFLQGAVQVTSDRAKKRNFSAVDGKAVLDAIAAMEITEWEYKNNAGVRHVGPTAQDFAAAFGLGDNDKTIATVDADGVALAAIQALYSQNQALAAQNAQLLQRLAALEAAVAGLND